MAILFKQTNILEPLPHNANITSLLSVFWLLTPFSGFEKKIPADGIRIGKSIIFAKKYQVIMYIYKFRVLNDEVDGFVRDFEIGAKQTFKDFHDAMLKNIKGLNPKELASFYICDRKWNKVKEITLLDMDADMEEFQQEENLDEQDQYLRNKKTIMDEAVLCHFIDDPHQRMIYEQDFMHPHPFYIELIKSSEGKEGKNYPICTHSSGELPKPLNLRKEDDFDDLLEEEDAYSEEDDFFDSEDLEGLSTDLSEDLGLM